MKMITKTLITPLIVVSTMLLISCSRQVKVDDNQLPDEEKYEIVNHNRAAQGNDFYIITDKYSNELFIFVEGRYVPMTNSDGSTKIYNKNMD